MPWTPPIAFCRTVGQASFQTAGMIGPSTIERSKLLRRVEPAVADAETTAAESGGATEAPAAPGDAWISGATLCDHSALGAQSLAISFEQSAFGFQLQVTSQQWSRHLPLLTLGSGYWLLVTGYWLLVTGYWLLVTGYWLLATRTQPPSASTGSCAARRRGRGRRRADAGGLR